MSKLQPITHKAETAFQATSSALTDTYALVGREIPVQGHTSGFFHLLWSKGDETSVEVKFLYANASGGTESQSTIITTAGATSSISPAEFSTATTGNQIIPFGAEGRFVNIYIKATGGTPTGTYGGEIFFKVE